MSYSRSSLGAISRVSKIPVPINTAAMPQAVQVSTGGSGILLLLALAGGGAYLAYRHFRKGKP